MTTSDKAVLVDGLKRLSKDIADIASALESSEAGKAEQENSAQEKVNTYEEVRMALGEKSRSGFRAEVKALLTAHGVKQLSDVSDPAVFAAIMAEAEGIGNG